MNNRGRQIYKPEFRFGLGGVSLGNDFNKHTDKDAEATLALSKMPDEGIIRAWGIGVNTPLPSLRKMRIPTFVCAPASIL
jgi:hypothetical protein